MTLKSLYEKRASKVEELKAIHAITLGDAARALTTEEREKFSAIETEVNELTDTIERDLRMAGHSTKSAGILALQPTTPAARAEIPSALGLTDKEAKRFSIVRAIRALADRDWSGAGFERECSNAIAQRTGNPSRGFYLPYEAWRQWSGAEQRDVTKSGTSSATIQTELQADSFIELLRNKSLVLAAGATTLPGLVGDVAIPRQSGGGTAYWLTNESTTVTESTQTFNQVTMSPKTVAGRSDISRRMLLQSTPAMDRLIQDDLRKVLSIAIDLAALYGSGASGQPTGVVTTAGIGSVTTSGAASLAWSHVVNLWREVSIDNADMGTLAYITNATIAALFKVTQKASNTGIFFMDPDGSVNGYPCLVTNQVAAGDCLYGNWADLLIGEWGVLDVTVDTVTLGDIGGLVVRAFADVDIAVRHPESFSAFLDCV